MWLKLCLLVLCGVCSTQSVRITPFQDVAVANGSSLVLTCSDSMGQALTWKKENKADASQHELVEATVNEDIENISRLSLSNVTYNDAATYRCISDGIKGREEATVTVSVFAVVAKHAEFTHNEDATLSCNVDETGSHNVEYSWKKGDTPVTEIAVEGKQAFIPHENGTLEIKHPLRSFAGEYTCTAKFEKNGKWQTIEKTVVFYAKPKVIPFDKSKNLVEKEKLVIECKVLGFPKPNITWWKGGKQITVGENSRYKLSPAKTYNEKSIDDAMLEIESVVFDDGGQYMCMSQNSRWPSFNSTQVILVRVKDQLAALWPFLGILAEVIILCTIIFIYEKKRSKDTTEEEDVNQDGAAPEKQTEGVRHRGSNNPRA